MANARRLAEIVSATPEWKVVAPVHLQAVCVRHEPNGLAGVAPDAYTRALAEATWTAIQRHASASLKLAESAPSQTL
jgi:glutamate/tyrosine decarboxylase-like PLP-dependent enzyme